MIAEHRSELDQGDQRHEILREDVLQELVVRRPRKLQLEFGAAGERALRRRFMQGPERNVDELGERVGEQVGTIPEVTGGTAAREQVQTGDPPDHGGTQADGAIPAHG